MKKNIKTLAFVIALLLSQLPKSLLASPLQQSKVVESKQRDLPDLTFLVQQKGIGKPIPTRLSSYRGKWLLIDFWAKYCSICIQRMPGLDSLRKAMDGKMEFLLVGNNDRHGRGIEELYQRIRKLENLQLDIAFDSISFKAFNIGATPIVVLISPEGKVAYQGSEKPTTEKLERLINGHRFSNLIIPTIYPLRTITDTISAIPHQSSFAPFGPVAQRKGQAKLYPPYQKFWTEGTNIITLFHIAFFGKWYIGPSDSLYRKIAHRAILENADSTALISDFRNGNGLYSYRIETSKSQSKQKLMTAMQQDLEKLTGHYGTIEHRQAPILELIVTDTLKAAGLKSKATDDQMSGDRTFRKFRGARVDQIIQLFATEFQQQPIFDGTNMSYTIDLDLEANMTSLPSLRKALQLRGLDLRPTTKLLQTLVIRKR